MIWNKKRSQSPPQWLRVLIPAVLILTWFGLGAVGGPYFGRIEEVSEVDLTAFLPESSEAAQVAERSSDFRSDNVLPGIVVFENGGSITSAQEKTINGLSDEFADIEGVAGTVSPAIISDDKEAALVSVPIDGNAEVGETVAEIKSSIDEADTGLDSYVTGPAGFAADLNVAFSGIDGILLAVALSVVFVILVVVYRSPILPFVVLSTSVFALSASILLVWNLANQGIVELNGQVQGILFILVIGAATDYSLLYVSRFREELYKTKVKYEATVASLKGSIEPILASGGTVIVGLLCLLLSDLASNQALGPVGSIGIAMAMLSALTFLPSVLFFLGRNAFWPVRPKADLISRKKHAAKLKKGIWHKVGEVIEKYPRRIWVSVSVVLIAFAIGVFQLDADGVAQSDLILGESEARDGQQVLSEHFPDGSGSPALALVPAEDQKKVVAALYGDDGVSSVVAVANDSLSGQKPLGRAAVDIKSDIRAGVEAKNPNLPPQAVDALVLKAYPFSDVQETVKKDNVLLQVTLTDDPDSDKAANTIKRIRNETQVVSSATIIGGPTASQLDTNTASIRDRAVIIPIVLIAITLILMLLLRSVLAPILLLLTTVVSFGTALGVAALLFNYVWDFPGADPSVILYGFVFLVALGIDYNIFLMTRVREEALKIGTKKGVVRGLIVTGGVITSAGIVLAATFAALAVIPILFLVQLAFIVSFGVLLDTIIVRSLLVPALIRDLGSVVWWPSKLKNKP